MKTPILTVSQSCLIPAAIGSLFMATALADPQSEGPNPAPPAQVTLTGIAAINGKQWVLFMVQERASGPRRSGVLSEGQNDGTVEILGVDQKAGSVKIKVSGKGRVLWMTQDGVGQPLSASAPAPTTLTPIPASSQASAVASSARGPGGRAPISQVIVIGRQPSPPTVEIGGTDVIQNNGLPIDAPPFWPLPAIPANPQPVPPQPEVASASLQSPRLAPPLNQFQQIPLGTNLPGARNPTQFPIELDQPPLGLPRPVTVRLNQFQPIPTATFLPGPGPTPNNVHPPLLSPPPVPVPPPYQFPRL